MENVAFYREWLPLNKKEFRILAMLADFGGEYHGNLTDMCRYFSVSPQHKNREALREAIQHLTDRHYIESSVNGRTYSLRIIPKEKEIALPREWLERVRTREYRYWYQLNGQSAQANWLEQREAIYSRIQEQEEEAVPQIIFTSEVKIR